MEIVESREAMEVEAESLAMPEEIEAALGQLNMAIEKHGNIRRLLSEARRERSEVVSEFEQALGAFGEAEAAVVLDGGQPNRDLQKIAEKHQRGLMAVEARIRGLGNREKAAVDTVDVAMRNLSDALQSWASAAVATAQAAMKAATENFLAAACGPLGIGLALGDRYLDLVRRTATIPDPEHAGRNALSALSNWRENAPLMAAYGQFAGVKSAVSDAITRAREAVAPAAE